ncbi:MAG: uracil-DNA glycosylase [Zoogloeaceae bacterium]|nr:uracil-DNA glycosylase [Zoogloeaceae bacterium]
MGLAPLWRLRSAADASTIDGPAEPAAMTERVAEVAPPSAPTVASEVLRSSPSPSIRPAEEALPRNWPELLAEIAACRACKLGEHRKQAVPGVGDRQADWLFVGEGPGAEEDERGEPFVGQAGRLLDNMLAAIGLARGQDVYIANAVKCRPPHNRTPEADEIIACRGFLDRQIAMIAPRLIVALGRPAAQSLLDREVKIAGSRGRIFQRGEVPVIITYHPAYLLRNPHDKPKAWEDLCFARATMAQLKNAPASIRPSV